MRFSVIIPNWNGRKLLAKNLPSVLAAGPDELIVVDNGSADGSVAFLEKISEVKLIKNPTNLGFARAVNQGVKAASGEIVVLLNNDVIPQKDFLKPLGANFSDPKVFGVSLNEKQWSWAKGQWIKGFVEHEPGKKVKEIHDSFWASGGSGAFRKKIWEELNGFDLLFEPFYWEDIDLSYRALKRGYRILWEPKARVVHEHEASVSRFSKNYVNLITQRNQLLFIWKNITDLRMLLEHKIWLLWRLRKPGYWRVLIMGLVKIPWVVPKWIKEKKEAKVSDRAIFAKFEKNGG